MEVNTLVRHKKLKTAGIGCIAKVLSKTVTVNWGTYEVTVCKPSELQVIDTSKCPTIPWSIVRTKIVTQQGPDKVIIGNELMEYVGIGWTSQRVVTEADLKKYPRVVN